METIKNILNPGSAQDDKLSAGTNPRGTLSGEGSHFAQAKNINPTSELPRESPAVTAGMPGAYPAIEGLTNPYTAKEVDSRLGGAAQQGTTGLGSSTAESQGSTMLSKADPQVDSGFDKSQAVGSTESDHHYEREAASVGGAAALVGGMHHKHETERGDIGSTGSAAYTGTTPGGMGSSYYGGPSGTAVSGLQSSTTTDPVPAHIIHSSETTGLGTGGASLAGLEQQRLAGDGGMGSTTGTGASDTFDDHPRQPVTYQHYGRDAVFGGAGLAGAAALGKHEYDQHEADGRTAGISSISTAASTSEPHSSDMLNKLDPRIDSKAVPDSQITQQPIIQPTTTSANDNHYGRDAAVGGAGLAGVSVLGKHEHDKHEAEQAGASTFGTGPAQSTSGPHSSDIMNKADPTVDSKAVVDGSSQPPLAASTSSQPSATQLSATQTPEKDHHYGRDAAVGGAGLAGVSVLGKHEHDKHEAEQAGASTFGTGPVQSTSGHSSNLMNKADPSVDSKAAVDSSTQSPQTAAGASTLQQSSATQTSEKDHHYGRDAAVGGAGLAGVSALGKHENDKYEAEKADSSTVGTGPAPNTSGPHKHDWMNRLDPRVDHKAGLENPTEPQSSSSGAKDHHHGREAAGVGAAGVGAHEISKHDKEKELEKTGGTSTLPTESTSASDKNDHHYGRDAAAVGAAGLGAHEIIKHHKEKEFEKSDENSNLTSDTIAASDKKDHQYGRDAAGLGAAGLGAHEISKHHQQKELEKAGGASTVPAESTIASDKKGHHYGRDAAGLGAAGLGAHEISKHHKDKELGTAEGASTVPSQGIASSDKEDHHYGRDAAGLGAAGLGAHEISKHHKEKELEETQPTSVTKGSAAIPGMSISEQTIRELPRGNDFGKNIQDPRYGMPGEGAPHNFAGESVGQDRGVGATGAAPSKDHHYGRDATAAGVVGAGAYEAEKHHKHNKDLTAEEKEEKREHKHELKEEKKHQHDVKEERKHSSGGILSFLHRDKNKKYSKEEEDEFDRQEREHNSHKGRDAALGSAAVGGAAYEAEKHHHGHHSDAAGATATTADTMKPLPTAPGNHGIGTGEGTQNALADRTHATGKYELGQIPVTSSGKDAVAVVGGAGAVPAVTAAHEQEHKMPNVLRKDPPAGYGATTDTETSRKMGSAAGTESETAPAEFW